MEYQLVLILSTISLCFCCEDNSKITFLPPFSDLDSIQSIPGEDILLVCCHPDGAENLRWENQERNVISYTNTGGIFSLKDEKNRLILRINNINEKMAGSYSCRNSNRVLYRSILITLKKKPLTPNIFTMEKTVPKIGVAKVDCPLKPRQTFKSWKFTQGNQNLVRFRTGKWKNYEISENNLQFIITMNDASETIKILWCEFQEVNDKGEVFSGLYEIKFIFYDPIDVAITMDHKGPILEGQNVSLICTFKPFHTQVANFPSNIMKPNFNITQSPGKVFLTIPKITKDLENEYQCKVTKFLSQIPFRTAEENAKIQISVLVPPKIIKDKFIDYPAKLDTEIQLKCDVLGSLLDDVYFEKFNSNNSTWIRVDTNADRFRKQIQPKEGKMTLLLLIDRVEWDDRGKYRCSAMNAAGKDSLTGNLKVEKSPQLHTKKETVDIAMKPVEIDCSVSGFPVSNTNNSIELKVRNATSNIVIKLLDHLYDEIDGLKVRFEVSLLKKVMDEEIYVLECLYHGTKLISQSKIIELRSANSPDIPKVNLICTGSTGIVLSYEKPEVIKSSKKVTKNELFYAPFYEFDVIRKKPSNVVPINYYDDYKFVNYTLRGLMPDTNYSLKWESFNSFQISSSKILTAKTQPLSVPNQPTDIKFSTKEDLISVTVKWQDECPYEGAKSAIRDVVVNMKPVHSIQQWNWVEENITVDISKSNLQFLISLQKPRIDYNITVELRSKQGTSKSFTGTYKANQVLAGKLSCFPGCSGINSLCSLNVIKLAVFVVVPFLLMI